MSAASSNSETTRQNDTHRGRRFSEALALLVETIERDRVDIGTIIRLMGERSSGALLLFLALPMVLPVPAPGISVAFGIPLILISAQLSIGRHHIWLPARLTRHSMSRSEFRAFVTRVLPPLRRLESVVRPRLPWLAADWTIAPVGVICLVLAVIITLPVPLGHMLPGAAICLLALGLIERDGVAVGLGLTVAVIALAVVSLVSHGLITWLHAHFV